MGRGLRGSEDVSSASVENRTRVGPVATSTPAAAAAAAAAGREADEGLKDNKKVFSN